MPTPPTSTPWVPLWPISTPVPAVGLLDRQSGAVDNNNSATETTIYTYTIAGNTVVVGDTIHLSMVGSTQRVAEILTLRLYLGATVIWTNTFNVSISQNDLWLDAWIHHIAAASQVGAGRASIAQNAYNVYGTSAIDMTASAVLKITAQSSAAVNGSYLRRQQVLVNLHKGS